MPKKIEFKWRRGFDVALVVSEINKHRKQEGGKVSYIGSDLTEYTGVLNTALVRPEHIRSEVVAWVLRRALFRPTQNAKLSPDGILAHALDEYRRYMKRRPRDYYLVTSWSYRAPFPIKRWTIEDCVISFGVKGEKFFKPGEKGRGSITDRLRHLKMLPQKKSYPIVTVKTTARSDREAFQKSIDALDLARAIINLPLNGRIGIRFTSGQRDPINAVRLGPAHTLHKQNGDMIENFWYEPEFVEPVSLAKIPEQLEARYFDYWKRVFRKSKLAEETRHGLIQYVRALDNPDPTRGFQELWAILEYLAGTQLGQDHGVTVRRIAALYKERRLKFETANYLRIQRNQLVHFSKTSKNDTHESEVMVCQAKSFVESFLWFYASYGSSFETQQEVGEFLDLREKLSDFGKSKRIMRLAERLYRWDN